MSVYALFYYMVLFLYLNTLLYLRVSPFVRALKIENKTIGLSCVKSDGQLNSDSDFYCFIF